MINYPEDAAVGLSIHSWLVKTPEDIILIDTATGNGRNRGGIPLFDHLNSDYLERLKQTGIAEQKILCRRSDCRCAYPEKSLSLKVFI
ncbi:hypothetical protein J1786_07065 [Rahnella sp. L72c]|uniref:Uncharacterized protein n=1 Tax=Rahnella perminowiae TaxID=2816244 RepID=A0ABS6KYA3_9GAMM|nr:hypothetical protein [Rahnella perminowiae]MBU9834575.1 hypothetical protein [Rahnella perminowiae]